MTQSNIDFILADHGSIVVLTPTSDEAKEWTHTYISDAAQWFGNGFVVEHRYADDIIERLCELDMTVRPIAVH